MYFFAELTGDMIGIQHFVKIEADNLEQAQEQADNLAEDNYSEYENPYEDEDETEPKFHAVVTEWDDAVHSEYLGQPCFTDHTSKNG